MLEDIQKLVDAEIERLDSDEEVIDLDWDSNSRRIDAKIGTLSDNEMRSHLRDLVIALNCVATNHDGGQEMTIEENMLAARTLLNTLGYPLVDVDNGAFSTGGGE